MSSQPERLFAVVAAVLAMVGVALGAFGAHALRGRLPASDLEVFETGVRYQMFHALALLAVAWACTRWPEAGIATAGWLFLSGIVVFSGSLYVLVLTDTRWLGAVTPVGGLALLAGWAVLAWSILRA